MKNPHPLAAHLLELFARRALGNEVLSGLAPGQWAILRRLKASAGSGRSLRQLARVLETDAKSAGRCVSALERKGLVTVGRDGSAVRVRLTEAGQLWLDGDPIGWIDSALIRLPPQDKRELCRMLAILLDAHAMDTPARRQEVRALRALRADPTRPRAEGEGRDRHRS